MVKKLVLGIIFTLSMFSIKIFFGDDSKSVNHILIMIERKCRKPPDIDTRPWTKMSCWSLGKVSSPSDQFLSFENN